MSEDPGKRPLCLINDVNLTVEVLSLLITEEFAIQAGGRNILPQLTACIALRPEHFGTRRHDVQTAYDVCFWRQRVFDDRALLRGKDSLIGFDGLPSRFVGIRDWEGFGRGIAGIIDFFQGMHNRGVVHMPSTSCLAV